MLKYQKFTSLIAAGAFAIFGLGVTGVAAVPVQSPVVDSETCDLRDLTTSSDCIGAFFRENDSGGFLDAIGSDGAFGYNPWEYVNKVDNPALTDGVLEVAYNSGGLTGSWSANLSEYGSSFEFIAVLKAGNAFAAYLLGRDFTGNVISSGTWDTVALNTTNAQGDVINHALSHFSLYKYECTDNDLTCGGGGTSGPPPVPLPAAGWMLIAGLGGLAAMKRRKLNKAA
jgi:hypothetical protein